MRELEEVKWKARVEVEPCRRGGKQISAERPSVFRGKKAQRPCWKKEKGRQAKNPIQGREGKR